MSLQEKLVPVQLRYEELSALMAEGNLSGEDFIKLSKEYSALSPVVEAVNEYNTALQEKEDLKEMLSDPEMKEMAQEEFKILEKRIPELEQELKVSLLPKDEADSRNAILEIRAGTGGDEAAIFAGNLFTMYKGYASKRGWKIELVDSSESEAGGYKQIIAEIKGTDVFSKLKFESGAHRVQRVPKTESQGRVHTSAATVAVLAEAEEFDVEIKPDDLKIDTYRAQGAGGQHVNTTDSAVRITHIPTGVISECQDQRSQHKNKAKAMAVLKTRIYDIQRKKLDDERAANRKSQIGSGDRSERIRTYNYPQGRVTDHRINLTLYKLDEVISGECLDEIIDALITEHQAELLSEYA